MDSFLLWFQRLWWTRLFLGHTRLWSLLVCLRVLVFLTLPHLEESIFCLCFQIWLCVTSKKGATHSYQGKNERTHWEIGSCILSWTQNNHNPQQRAFVYICYNSFRKKEAFNPYCNNFCRIHVIYMSMVFHNNGLLHNPI